MAEVFIGQRSKRQPDAFEVTVRMRTRWNLHARDLPRRTDQYHAVPLGRCAESCTSERLVCFCFYMISDKLN